LPLNAQAVRTLKRAADAASTARAEARAMCDDLGEVALVDDVVLVVSELVTNAVQHGQGEIVLELEVQGERVLVTVADDGPGEPQLPDPVAHGAEGGRGLALVAAVAQEWGVHPAAEGGKAVWCVLGLDPADPVPDPDAAPLTIG
jgi:anti-sigma regulatory factor (Ser/Thr protein kinase)